ncbi:hypothetical protein NDU88_004513 [Pleurodeles waltl]|uniref:Uncharacterized protein n=1 Tax=Pleurodeles waltl TaxID=8319 RepID=A0AAV7TSW4_PLEWA|nr:hypothetical protein NDU88_004513 [Pleurodeles waltl]
MRRRGQGRQDGGRTLRVLRTPLSSALIHCHTDPLFRPTRDLNGAAAPLDPKRPKSGAPRGLGAIGRRRHPWDGAESSTRTSRARGPGSEFRAVKASWNPLEPRRMRVRVSARADAWGLSGRRQLTPGLACFRGGRGRAPGSRAQACARLQPRKGRAGKMVPEDPRPPRALRRPRSVPLSGGDRARLRGPRSSPTAGRGPEAGPLR